MEQAQRPEDIISQWNKDDYLQGDEPYKWLYSLMDDSFLMTRMKTLMAGAAKKAGVTNFSALWKSYLETQMGGNSKKNMLVNVTEFSGQPMELRCGEYLCNDFGISYINSYQQSVCVCPHPIMPVRRLVNIDTGEVKTEIAYKRGAYWKKCIYDKGVLSNARNVTALSSCGISVTSESAKDIVRYLACLEDGNYDELPETETVGRMGWIAEYGFSPYVDGLEYDNNGMYAEAFRAISPHGSCEEWMRLAKEVRAGDSTPCRIALAAGFASVLIKKMDALPFFVHLWGTESSIGKSVGMCLAASIWGYPEIGGGYVQSMRQTDIAFEQIAAFCGNLPLCMDELQQIQDRKDFDSIIYMLCEGAAKGRGAKTGGLRKTQHWRNVMITTGEQPILSSNSKAGAVSRVIEVECDKKLFADPREAFQIMVRNYGHAGREFVKALMAHEDAMDVMVETQKNYYDQLFGKATDKQVLSASLLLAADAMADLLLFDDGNSLTADDIMPFLVTKAQADTNRRAYEWVCDWIASNPGHFKTNSYGEYGGECWGCIENNRAYIISGTFNRVMKEQGFNPASFLSWAKRSDMIETSHVEKRMTIRKRIPGSQINSWCVCLCVPTDDGTVTASGDLELPEDQANQIRF